MRIEEMTALRPGLFENTPAEDVGTANPEEFMAPTQELESENHGLQIEHSRSDLNKGAGIRL